MEKKIRNTRQDVIDFFNKHHRAPTKDNRPLYRLMCRLYKKGDDQIIVLREKYKDNTKKFAQDIKIAGACTKEAIQKAKKTRSATMQKKWSEKVSKIRKQHEETGKWPDTMSTDYSWIIRTKSKSVEVAKLWEDMHQEKPGEKKEIQKPVEKTPAGIEAKRVSELTLSEISELLKLIGNKTVGELIAEPEKIEEPKKVDISKIETSLSEDSIRTIIDPNNKEVIVTNSNWKRAKEVLEYVFEDDTIKRHFAYEKLRESRIFVQLVANYAKDNPKKTFRHKDKIVERICSFIPADRYFLENPANIQDLVTNCF